MINLQQYPFITQAIMWWNVVERFTRSWDRENYSQSLLPTIEMGQFPLFIFSANVGTMVMIWPLIFNLAARGMFVLLYVSFSLNLKLSLSRYCGNVYQIHLKHSEMHTVWLVDFFFFCFSFISVSWLLQECVGSPCPFPSFFFRAASWEFFQRWSLSWWALPKQPQNEIDSY